MAYAYIIDENKTKVGTPTFSNVSIAGSLSGNTATFSGNVTISGDLTGSSAKKVTGFGTVENAVWNDLVDSIEIPENTGNLLPGKCYILKNNLCKLTENYAEKGILGIHSDTYGMRLGYKENVKSIDLAVAGFVLAYVDKEYESGTPLTCTAEGSLTELLEDDFIKKPWALVGFYYKPELNKDWNGIKVDGRHWVKIK